MTVCPLLVKQSYCLFYSIQAERFTSQHCQKSPQRKIINGPLQKIRLSLNLYQLELAVWHETSKKNK